jgi:type I restriction-modification system DNA methylase subunit
LRNTVLAELASIGSFLQWAADPNNYAHQYRKRADYYKNDVLLCKESYDTIRNGGELSETLTTLFNNLRTNSEKNKIQKILNEI